MKGNLVEEGAWKWYLGVFLWVATTAGVLLLVFPAGYGAMIAAMGGMVVFGIVILFLIWCKNNQNEPPRW